MLYQSTLIISHHLSTAWLSGCSRSSPGCLSAFWSILPVKIPTPAGGAGFEPAPLHRIGKPSARTESTIAKEPGRNAREGIRTPILWYLKPAPLPKLGHPSRCGARESNPAWLLCESSALSRMRAPPEASSSGLEPEIRVPQTRVISISLRGQIMGRATHGNRTRIPGLPNQCSTVELERRMDLMGLEPTNLPVANRLRSRCATGP